jgi:hypothetical protein
MIEARMAEGDELLSVIAEYADLEWKKCRRRTVHIVMKNGKVLHEEHSGLPPFTTVRFRSENQETVARLKASVEGYDGMARWQRLALPGTNWVISPAFVDDLRAEAEANGARDVSHYIEKKYPDLAQKAYVDLLGLAKYVRSELLEKGTGTPPAPPALKIEG